MHVLRLRRKTCFTPRRIKVNSGPGLVTFHQAPYVSLCNSLEYLIKSCASENASLIVNLLVLRVFRVLKLQAPSRKTTSTKILV